MNSNNWSTELSKKLFYSLPKENTFSSYILIIFSHIVNKKIIALMIGPNNFKLIDMAKNMDDINYTGENIETFARFVQYVIKKDNNGEYNSFKEKILGGLYNLVSEKYFYPIELPSSPVESISPLSVSTSPSPPPFPYVCL